MKRQFVPLGDLVEPAPLNRAGRRCLPILSMTMHGGLVDQASKFKKRVASLDTSAYKVVARNQLVVGFPIDEGVLSFQQKYDEAIVSPAYDTWNLSNHARVLPSYLERFLRSPAALSFYKNKLRGTTARRRSLPDDVFVTLPVPLPPLSEQRRIVEILDRADALRAKRRAALALLDTLTQSIFLDMFGDPVNNPRGWPTRPVEEVADVVTGNTPSRARPEYYGDELDWIKSDNILFEDYYVTAASERLSAAGVAVGRTAPAGSILVVCIAGSPASIGRSAMTNKTVAFNQQINALIPRTGNPHFLLGQLRANQRLVQSASTASMKGMVSKSKLEALRVIWPPVSEQDRFAKAIDTVRPLQGHSQRSLAHLDALFASLQHRAFRGEL